MIKSRLKILLAEHNMTQKELSEKTNIRQSTVSDICNNKIKHIPVTAIDTICEVLNCQIGELFTRDK